MNINNNRFFIKSMNNFKAAKLMNIKLVNDKDYINLNKKRIVLKRKKLLIKAVVVDFIIGLINNILITIG